MKTTFLPNTSIGKWSVRCILSFFGFMIIFFVIVEIGEPGGETFFQNLKLAIPILLAGISGIAALITGIVSFIISKEKSVSVILATIVGLFVLIFALGEILGAH